jgi:hypothetical protein
MMFVGSPIPYIKAAHLNQAILLGFLQDAFGKGSCANVRKECQDIKTGHSRTLSVPVRLNLCLAPQCETLTCRNRRLRSTLLQRADQSIVNHARHR